MAEIFEFALRDVNADVWADTLQMKQAHQKGLIMAWAYLAAAAAFEIVFALSMKYADGFTRLLPTLITAIAATGGIGFLTLALRTLPVSVAYPIWTAVGTLGAVLLGFVLLDERLTLVKAVSALAIVAGVAGLRAGSV